MTDVTEEEVVQEVVAPEVEETTEATENAPDLSELSDEDFMEMVASESTNVEAVNEGSDEPSEPVDAITSEEEEVVPEADTEEKLEFSKEDAYDAIMAEFKANGKMMQVDTVEDVRQLMKMGAGFNKKTTDLKKDIKFIKMLESNDLLDETKLNYLIDLSKKDKGAIQQLLKDGEIELNDLDVSGESVYTPNSYTVSEERAKLDSVLESLQDSPAYATTIDIVGIKWDKASREALASAPDDIRVINGHVENGIYDQIVAVVDREKMMGRLDNLTDYEAYRKVGDAMNARGMFKASNAEPVQSKPKAAVEGRRSAAPTTSSSARPEGKSSVTDMVNMSDEEFLKNFG